MLETYICASFASLQWPDIILYGVCGIQLLRFINPCYSCFILVLIRSFNFLCTLRQHQQQPQRLNLFRLAELFLILSCRSIFFGINLTETHNKE